MGAQLRTREHVQLHVSPFHPSNPDLRHSVCPAQNAGRLVLMFPNAIPGLLGQVHYLSYLSRPLPCDLITSPPPQKLGIQV